MEAGCLGLLMIAACVFGVLLEHPMSPVQQTIENPEVRRALMGLAIGLSSAGIIYSPWGQRSGAHLNPAVTLTFLSLGKVKPWDSLFYILSQFAGGVAGVALAEVAIGPPLAHGAVNYLVTVPGAQGAGPAFLAEFLLSIGMMTVVLSVSNSQRLSRFTPLFAGALAAVYITLEGPVSGMSMNPARTFGSAFAACEFRALWIYFTAPLAGMLLAGLLYRFRYGSGGVFCAKLHHANSQPCIFQCNYGALRAN